MTPAARLQETIAILGALDVTAQPLDRLLRDWFRVRRYAGSKDRAAVGAQVFDIMRHRASLTWRMESDAPRVLVLGLLQRDGLSVDDIAAQFSGGKYGPAPLTDEERVALERAPGEEAPLSVQGEYPAFLDSELCEAFGADVLDEMQALTERAPVDLRVNRLKATQEDVLNVLQREGFEAQPTPFSPNGVRLPVSQAASRLREHALFKSGAFVFQDEASQIAALLSGAQPSQRVLDIAAGAGGKSLALAALMQNRGTIVASDIREDALAELQRRADVAGATIIRISPLPDDNGGEGQGQGVPKVRRALTAPSPQPSPPMREGERDSSFDLVFVDAPCSGSGAWRRQPENKWRLTPERLAQLHQTQTELLKRAAAFVKPGGRLLYATCSILPSENERQVETFLQAHADFTVHPAYKAWRGISESPLPGADRYWRGSPYSTGTDGFYCAILTRAA